MADSPRLHPAERAAREAYASRLENDARLIADAELSRAATKKASQVRQAIPYLDYVRAMDAHRFAQSQVGTGFDANDQRAAHSEAMGKLRESNPYPPDMTHAVDAELKRGVNPADLDLGAVLNPAKPLSKSRPRAGTLSEAEHRKSALAYARREVASLDKDIAEFRRDLAEFKKAQEEAAGNSLRKGRL